MSAFRSRRCDPGIGSDAPCHAGFRGGIASRMTHLVARIANENSEGVENCDSHGSRPDPKPAEGVKNCDSHGSRPDPISAQARKHRSWLITYSHQIRFSKNVPGTGCEKGKREVFGGGCMECRQSSIRSAPTQGNMRSDPKGTPDEYGVRERRPHAPTSLDPEFELIRIEADIFLIAYAQ